MYRTGEFSKLSFVTVQALRLYDEIGEAYNAIMRWIASHNYRVNGFCREVYPVSPGDTRDPNQYVSEILIPVTEGEME
jgi:effector-binding domain-containing protein